MYDLKTESIISKARLALLRNKTWRYLRYLHFRDTLSQIADEIETVCVCGTGHGYAEIAVAAEFPHIDFILTDIIDRQRNYPNYHKAMDMAWQWGVDNVQFSVWNVLKPTRRRFDLIASTEMLEHIEDDKTAALRMGEAATKFLYCLVPFADDESNNTPRKRKRAWEAHEHYVCGYDADKLEALFPNPVLIEGTYWETAGQKFRSSLMGMADSEIIAEQSKLELLAEHDLIKDVPKKLPTALGIKILSRAA
ncbi:MAG: methyltransferase domain-containing protein [Pseudomonadota bacterium]